MAAHHKQTINSFGTHFAVLSCATHPNKPRSWGVSFGVACGCAFWEDYLADGVTSAELTIALRTNRLRGGQSAERCAYIVCPIDPC